MLKIHKQKILLLVVILAGAIYFLWPRSTDPKDAFADLEQAHIGILMVDVDTLKPHISYNADHHFTPASVNKLYTTAAALHLLGPHFQWETTLWKEGRIDEKGELQGNLILQAGGDATFNEEKLKELVKAVQEKGIRSIKGDLVIDTSLFQGSKIHPHREWEDLIEAHNSEVIALSYNHNWLSVEVVPGTHLHDPARLKTSHPQEVLNQIETVEGDESTVSYEGTYDEPFVTFKGTIGINSSPKTFTIALKSPSSHVYNQFLNLLGIQPKKENLDPREREVLKTVTSKTLSEIIVPLTQDSDNLLAEVLHRSLDNSPSKTLKGAMAREKGWFQETLNWTPYLFDGSGLSRHAQITPRQTVELLLFMLKSPYREIWLHSLAEPGTGTLKERLHGLPVKGKTGGMQGISSLAGYIEKKGRKFAFALFINHACCGNKELREKLDAGLTKLWNMTLPSSEEESTAPQSHATQASGG